MPWVSMPYGGELAQALGSKFGVRGIPSLIVLDGVDASVKDDDGRSTITAAKGDTAKAMAKWA
jgi:hypothetical protein